MFQTKFVEKIKRHIPCSITLFPKIIVYEMWKNLVQPVRRQMAVWRIRIECRIPKATDAHSEYVTLIASLLHLLHEHASMSRYTYSDCIVRLHWGCVTTLFQLYRLMWGGGNERDATPCSLYKVTVVSVLFTLPVKNHSMPFFAH